jgi:hypothetical protein
MNRLILVILVSLMTVAGLGAVAKKYHAQISPTIHPVVIVYKVTSGTNGQNSNPTRFETLAVRSDGAFMMANSAPDASGHISVERALELKDRYVIVDPQTESVLTYKPYRPMVVATQDCAGRSDTPILGFATEMVSHVSKRPKGQEEIVRWPGLDINCMVLREHITSDEDTGQVHQEREAVSVERMEPPAEYFDIPASYHERGPAEINSELEKRFSGRRVFGSDQVVQRLQKIYDANKLK